MNRYYTTHEAARLLGVSLPTVVNWIKGRQLRCHRTPGGHRRIAREDLAAFMVRQGMALGELADAVPDPRKALVVGDLGPGREGLAVQLAQGGWAVDVASPGFAAGAALARFRPHVVVLLAPGPDGGDTLAALRADREAGETPVVAVGHADWLQPLARAGATRVLVRPLDAGALLAAAVEVAGPALPAPPPAPGDERPAVRRTRRPAAR